MRTITLEELLEAGSHFGHQVTRQNPKARDFIFEARDNIHIIDLAKTKEWLEIAGEFVKSVAAKPGSTMLLVATKRQAKPVIEEALKKFQGDPAHGIFSVTNRWIGGTLTNYTEIAKNCKKLKDLSERLQNDEEKEKYTKKEVGQWAKELQKLESFYGGVKDMKGRPDVVFIIDAHLENLAVREADATHVPTVAITDTNADPTLIKYPIPANDDAVGSIQIITDYILEAWNEGKEELAKITKEEIHENHEQDEDIAKNTNEETNTKIAKKENITKSTKVKITTRKTRTKKNE